MQITSQVFRTILGKLDSRKTRTIQESIRAIDKSLFLRFSFLCEERDAKWIFLNVRLLRTVRTRKGMNVITMKFANSM